MATPNPYTTPKTAPTILRSPGQFLKSQVKSRDEQAADCRAFVEHRSGSYVYTYEEPNTSAYKRRRVRDAEARSRIAWYVRSSRPRWVI
jgi:hypothetical protein